MCVFQESRSLLLEALRQAKSEGFCLGVKLVRGAYMDKERKLAEKEGRQDPIHKSWQDTNDRWSQSFIYSFIHHNQATASKTVVNFTKEPGFFSF